MILVAGEALYDLVVQGDSDDLNGHPGGGAFNTARTIGRLEQPVAYLGRLSEDRFGERLLGLHRRTALIGFDDLPLADAVEPGLTVVAQDAAELGRATAELLFARLDGDRGPTRRVEVPTTLIQRGSGELAA